MDQDQDENIKDHKKLLESRHSENAGGGGDKEKDDDINPNQMQRDGLTNIHIAAYSVGHFCNDLCAAMWFVYLSWYINKIVKLDATTTGFCMLSGQIADGITTPIVGFMSDTI